MCLLPDAFILAVMAAMKIMNKVINVYVSALDLKCLRMHTCVHCPRIYTCVVQLTVTHGDHSD